MPFGPAHSPRRACNRCDDHCEPVNHHRRIFDDAAGHSTWLAAAAADHPDLAEGYGQIYVGVVNWLLMIVTVGLTIGFGKSDNLAAAYGIAVSATC